MALTIIQEPGRYVEQVTAQEQFVVTLDGSRLVNAGESGMLLAAAGQKIPLPVAQKLGIGADGRRIQAAPVAVAPAAVPAPAIKESAPVETKELQPGATKEPGKARKPRRK